MKSTEVYFLSFRTDYISCSQQGGRVVSQVFITLYIVFALKAIADKAFLQSPILKQLFQVFCLPKTYRKDVLPPSMFKNKKKSWINNEIDKIFCNNFASIQVATFCNANMSISVGTQYILQKFKITFLQE